TLLLSMYSAFGVGLFRSRLPDTRSTRVHWDGRILQRPLVDECAQLQQPRLAARQPGAAQRPQPATAGTASGRAESHRAGDEGLVRSAEAAAAPGHLLADVVQRRTEQRRSARARREDD